MHRPLTLTLSAAAALALPVTALAHGHGPGGHGGGNHGRPATPGAQGLSHRCAKTHTVGFQLRGLFASYDGTTLTVSQARGNAHARPSITDGTAALAVGDARTSFGDVTDANNDGTVGWDDVTTLDRVIVHGRAAVTKHGCPAGDQTAPVIQRIRVVVPAASDAADSTDAGDATSTGSADGTGVADGTDAAEASDR